MTIRVAIDAQIPSGGAAGGAEQFIAALFRGLAELGDEDLEVTAVVPATGAPVAGLEPGARSARLRIVPGWLNRPTAWTSLARLLGPAAGPLRLARRILSRAAVRPATVVDAGDYYRQLGADVLHVAHQRYVRSTLPAVYTPHDLQHEHHPEFFAAPDLAARRAVYPAGCREAHTVVADARCVAIDIVSRFQIDPAKVSTIAAASPLHSGLTVDPERDVESRQALRLPQTFAFYPAQTWPHKNHVGLLRALAQLRVRDGARLDLVCTGARNDYHETVAAEVVRLGLGDAVHFLGYVPEAVLGVLYRSALFAVNPSLFEGAGLTVLEAFQAGAPVACSSLTSLPEYAGDAALLFDPRDERATIDALRRMLLDEALRRELAVRGAARARLFTREAMARRYRVIYRLAAGAPVEEAERRLLADTPLAPIRSPRTAS